MAYNDTEDVLKSQHRIAQLERELAEAKERMWNAEGDIASIADLANTWAREIGVAECKPEGVSIKALINEIGYQRNQVCQDHDTLKRLAGELAEALEEIECGDGQCHNDYGGCGRECATFARKALAAYKAATKQEQPR